MNIQNAFNLGLAPFSTVTFGDGEKTHGFYYDHHQYGSSIISSGMRYHRNDGRIGVAYK